MTPPRAPPPGGGCCYSQPESLGEGEEEVAVSAICRREVECEGAGGQGRQAWPAPHLPLGERCGPRVTDVFLR